MLNLDNLYIDYIKEIFSFYYSEDKLEESIKKEYVKQDYIDEINKCERNENKERQAIFQRQLKEYCNEKVGKEKYGKYEYGRGRKKVNFKNNNLLIEIKNSKNDERIILIKTYKKLCSLIEILDNFIFEDRDKMKVNLTILNKKREAIEW